MRWSSRRPPGTVGPTLALGRPGDLLAADIQLAIQLAIPLAIHLVKRMERVNCLLQLLLLLLFLFRLSHLSDYFIGLNFQAHCK